MNAKELKADMIKIDREVKGKISAQWAEGFHFWFTIFQPDNDATRTYSRIYECCEECGEEIDSYNSIEELFEYESSIAEEFDWRRVKNA